MNKTKLFTTKMSVLVNHLNYGNHLGYDSVLSILHEARIRWLKSLKPEATEDNIEENVGWLIREVFVSYESEAHYGDELSIDIFASDLKKVSFIMEYQVFNLTTNKPLCFGHTKNAFVNFAKGKIAKSPAIITEAIESCAQEQVNITSVV